MNKAILGGLVIVFALELIGCAGAGSDVGPTGGSEIKSGVGSPSDSGVKSGVDFAGGSLTVDGEGVCGDGSVNAGEECDDGNVDSESCAYGETSCTVCSADCTEVVGVTSYCGDGKVDPIYQEICDDQADNGQPNKCNLSCQGITSATCQNGIVEDGEECDGGECCGQDCSWSQRWNEMCWEKARWGA